MDGRISFHNTLLCPELCLGQVLTYALIAVRLVCIVLLSII